MIMAAMRMVVPVPVPGFRADVGRFQNHRRHRNLVAGFKLEGHLLRLAGHHGLAKAHEHDVKPARLQRDGPAGGNMDTAFALPHLHDAVVMDHLVNFHPLGKPGRCRNKPVIGMAFIGDADIATGDGHPRRGGADLNGSDFEHIGQRGAGDEGGGLGSGFATALAEAGAKVVLCGRREGPLVTTADAVRDAGGASPMRSSPITLVISTA